MPQPPQTEPVSNKQGAVLVNWARQVITRKLEQSIEDRQRELIREALKAPLFDEPRATFVTLKKAGHLRGCIGTLQALSPLKEDVRRNAEHAAFHDPRFSPLKASELAEIEIEVSILTAPQSLPYQDSHELLNKLRPRVDGVIIRKAGTSATFLPQVWEQLPHPEDFMDHLCLKARLPAKAWQAGDLKVETYQVQYFEETSQG